MAFKVGIVGLGMAVTPHAKSLLDLKLRGQLAPARHRHRANCFGIEEGLHVSTKLHPSIPAVLARGCNRILLERALHHLRRNARVHAPRVGVPDEHVPVLAERTFHRVVKLAPGCVGTRQPEQQRVRYRRHRGTECGENLGVRVRARVIRGPERDFVTDDA